MSIPRTDEDWIYAIARRDGTAHRELSNAIYEWVYNYLRHLPPQVIRHTLLPEIAYDCTAEAIIRILSRLEQYQKKGPFLGWCRVIALRITKNWIRADIQNRKKEQYLDAEAEYRDESEPLWSDEIGLVEKIIVHVNTFLESGLTEKERKIFLVLANIEGTRHNREKMAEELGTTRNNLDQTWFRARRKVREYLEKSGYTEEYLREYNLL